LLFTLSEHQRLTLGINVVDQAFPIPRGAWAMHLWCKGLFNHFMGLIGRNIMRVDLTLPMLLALNMQNIGKNVTQQQLQ
jgi:hypothetical protein